MHCRPVKVGVEKVAIRGIAFALSAGSEIIRWRFCQDGQSRNPFGQRLKAVGHIHVRAALL